MEVPHTYDRRSGKRANDYVTMQALARVVIRVWDVIIDDINPSDEWADYGSR